MTQPPSDRTRQTASHDPRDDVPSRTLERQSAEVELNRDEAIVDDPDSTLDPEDALAEDWVVADRARPDMTEETADGLDDTEEAVRHAAEDRSR